jgi:pantoate--beta-alanine ligase
MTKVVKELSKWKSIRKSKIFSNKTVGLVPTMGALHDAHLALIKKSMQQNDITVVTIFVNRTQFNNQKDFENYPNTIKEDLNKLKKLKVDYLLMPEHEDIYPDNYQYKVIESNFSKILCGKYRPGHFDGVLTIVLKLLNLVKPNQAYFGEKDYQQLKLIERMVNTFFIDTKIIALPTVRTKEGLALSSRNLKLSEEQKIMAVEFPKALASPLSNDEVKSRLMKKGFKVEYIEQIDNRRFGAVYLGNVRLIDNVNI